MPAPDLRHGPTDSHSSWLPYLWAAPNTAIGLSLAGLAAVTGGSWRVVDGVMEVAGGIITPWLRHAMLIEGGAAALTLGHVVVGQSHALLEQTRSHERAHVRQAERWGPFFLPAYATASAIALLRGGHYYRDNAFERAARREERSPAAA